MVKSDADVIKEFNELVNMTAPELEKWLKSDDSTSSGWTNGNSDGETVGHNSGTKIVDILKRNPDKKDDKYTDDDLKHMRKVVSYNKRHLAQEEHLKQKKSADELKQTKSYKSLKTAADPALRAFTSRLLLLLLLPLLLLQPTSPFRQTHGASDPLASPASSSSAPAASGSTFRSDVALPTALNLGKIGSSATTASTAAASSLASAQARLSSAEYLDQLEESVNKTIDAEIDTLLTSYKELVSLASIADKDKFRVAQEAFQTEARADIMVRSVQTLSLLSESLKLSLLLSKAPDATLSDEAVELMHSTEREKLKCAVLLAGLLGLDKQAAGEWVEQMDSNVSAKARAPPSGPAAPTVASETRTAETQAAAATPADAEDDDIDDDDMEDVSAG
ncbi:hypothetical protein PANT_3c00073 [Moesziomyces antarcticus T-34]|uniref:Uncharacterized protein n=1 Tax=Pseudozyma antarctica (strain T-34) TaxID=1151754 RepID=M9LSZ7_PSEA3|nr:hypothetical protein PANT_3c00073 [Moesziomyces antarcticus T-34]